MELLGVFIISRVSGSISSRFRGLIIRNYLILIFAAGDSGMNIFQNISRCFAVAAQIHAQLLLEP